MTLPKNRSRNADTKTPAHWQHVNIVEDFDDYKLTSGIFDSFIGELTCKAAKIPKAEGLTLQEALEYGGRLEAWLSKQEKKK